MYNVVRNRELRARGLNSRAIDDAVDCCLVKLTYGMYSIVRRCGKPAHSRVADLITDEAWIAEYAARTANAHRSDFQLKNVLEKLRVSSYPHYSSDGVVCGVSAAFIHDLPMFGITRPLIHIANPSRRARTRLISRTARTIGVEDVVRIGKMTLTSPVRTCLDLIGSIGEAGAFAAMETVVRRAAFGSEEAASQAGRIGYPPDTRELAELEIERQFTPAIDRLAAGQKRARRLIEYAGALSESYAESRCVYNLMLLGHTGFHQQVQIFDGRGLLARVDFADEEAKTILFVDGAAKYAENGQQLVQRESSQFNRLIGMGYRIVRFTFSEVMSLEDFATKLYNQAPWMRERATRPN